MGVYLLNNAPASTTGTPEDVRSICNYRISLQIDAFGGFGGSAVIIEESPDGGTTWFTVGTITNGKSLPVSDPIDLIRARTDGSLTGNATVIAEISG